MSSCVHYYAKLIPGKIDLLGIYYDILGILAQECGSLPLSCF